MILASLMQISFHCISVLPRFSVKISAPQYILPITGEFSVNITARYRYMKSVLTFFLEYFKHEQKSDKSRSGKSVVIAWVP